jgi:hypothetical protein
MTDGHEVCKHCGHRIAQITDGNWFDVVPWHHVEATDNNDGHYAIACACQCPGCTTDSTNYSQCCDGEAAEPEMQL